MKEMKRILALVLCFAMFVGLMPAIALRAEAAETPLAAAIFGSDIHEESTSLNGSGTSAMKSILSAIGSNGVTYNTIGFVGDTFTDIAGSKDDMTTAAQAALGQNAEVYYAWGDHDEESDISSESGLLYTGDYYYIYHISDADMRSKAGATSANVEAAISSFETAAASMDKSSVLFIMSHVPLHARRDDNTYANNWYTAIKEVADTMEVVFFWAHNHTSENDVDRAAYYVERDGSESITIEGGETIVPNFTYMNAGYIYAAGQNPSRKGVVTTVEIYADELVFQDYSSSGAYTDSTYSHNVTVTREFQDTVEEETTPAYITGIVVTTLPDKTVYDVGEELDTTGMVVTATYSDGTTAVVENWYTLNNLDMSTEGEKEVTVRYSDNGTLFDTTFQITVEEQAAADAVLESIEITSEPTKTEYLVSDALDITGMVVKATFSDGTVKTLEYAPFNNGDGYTVGEFCMYHEMDYEAVVSYTYGDVTCTDTFLVNVWEEDFTVSDVSVHVTEIGITGITAGESANANVETALTDIMSDYVAYDIDLTFYEGYSTTNADATVTLPIPEGVDNPVVYYVSDDGTTVKNMGAVKGDGVVTFTTDHFSTYVVGRSTLAGVESDATVPGYDNTVSTEVWKLTDTVTAGTYLIVNTNSAGEGYALLNNNGSVSAVAVTVVNDGTNTYIELDNANAEWTLSANASNSSYWDVKNSSYYLGHSGNWYSGFELTLDNSSESWSTNGTNLYFSYSAMGSTRYRYLAYSSGWTLSSSSSSVYFYTPATITTGTSVPDTTYHMDLTVDGNTVSNHAYTVNGVVSGTRVQMNAIYTATANGTSTTVAAPTGGSYTVLSSSNEAVATIGTDGVLTFTGVEGETLVQVEYTWTVNGVEYKTQNYVVITAKAPVYDMAIVTPESAQVKIGATVDLDATATADGTAIEDAVITWSSSDESIATVDANGVVTGVKAGNVTITASYTDSKGAVHTDTIAMEVVDAVYALEISKKTENADGTYTTEPITAPIVIKGVTNGMTHSVWAVITADGVDIGALTEEQLKKLSFTSSNESIATVDKTTGTVIFTGAEGTVQVTASYEYAEGKFVTDTVTFSVTTTQYSIPTDGTSDFPEYPNEGAIRYDKTATAVGNFSETGIAQIELSMTGVPYTKGSEIDVVIMLDITGSMHDVTSSSYTYSKYTRVEATIIATMEFVKSIVVNEDGTYNNNRVGVYSFNSGGTYTLWELGKVTDLATINAAIQKFNDNYKSGGTPYDDGLSKVQSVLNTAKTDGTGNNRQQFAVFMTDGVPTDYEYITGTTHANYSSASSIAGMLTSSDNYCTRDTDYYYEYYSTEMKKAGVTVYSVGIGLENTNSAWSGTAAQCLNLASRLLNDISGPAGETTQPDAVGTSTLSKQDSYFFSVDDATAATDMKNVFTNIAVKILQAATDITVEDKITDEYTMIFDIPTGSKNITGVTDDFYIEFVEYTLDETTHERTSTYTTLTKLYLGVSNGSYYAASDNKGTAYAAPVFENKVLGDKGTLYYWTTDTAFSGQAALSYSDGTNTYYFIPYGIKATDSSYDSTKWFNMTSGAYASGTIDSTTNMSENLVIATPYFVYNASTKMLYWTVDKISTTEYALRYFLYLDDSATEVGTSKETDPGSYLTNDYAYITYTNFNGNDCRQEFPKPQLTWSGAQVSYVFYLVNAQGQPINKSGQVVDFANAIFVTDVYTVNTVWNKGEDGKITADSELSIDWLANELLPADYKVYDEQAGYELHVYGDHTGTSIFDYFIIEGDTAANISSSLNSRLSLNTTASTVSVETTKVYNTKAGTKYDDYGTYTSKATDQYDNEIVLSGFDFYNTTVAFAVVWQPKLVPDTVVVDYGLDVLINVVQNDLMQNTISGIGTGNSAYGNTAMNTGVSTDSKLGTAALTIDGNTISIENENQIRFHQGDMTFEKSVVFYYESPVEFYEGSEKSTGYMYSSVTVIPATTIYYEDEFVDLKLYEQKYKTVEYTAESSTSETYYTLENGVYTKVSEPVIGETYYVKDGYKDPIGWTTGSTSSTATQQQDRPGASLISAALDADNNYGYDAAYAAMSTHSMKSAAMVNVTAGKYATAEFTFYGTGFDVISMTSNTTGTMTVKVTAAADITAADGSTIAAGTVVKSMVVDTYYGYTTEQHEILYTYTNGEWVAEDKGKAEGATATAKPETPAEGDTYTAIEQVWVATPDVDNALYQVPVIKAQDLAYGKYKVVITASYVGIFDHTTPDGYDLYLDAIRIYDPANDGASDSKVQDAYVADGEGWPSYIELRNKLIKVDTFNEGTTEIIGEVFIDGDASVGNAQMKDYTSYGPNNEVYLAKDQSIAFMLNTNVINSAGKNIVAKIQLGLKSADGNAVTYTIQNIAADGTVSNEKTATVSTTTDMYYDITAWKDGIIVITNSGESGIISLTNIKATYTEDPNASAVAAASLDEVEDNVAVASETSEVYAYMTPAATTLTLRSLNRAAVVEPEVTEPTEPEVTEPETSEPEVTEPETTEPEVTEPETTEPETTEPETTEPETTEPEETEPEEPTAEEVVKEIVKEIIKVIGDWLGKWF